MNSEREQVQSSKPQSIKPHLQNNFNCYNMETFLSEIDLTEEQIQNWEVIYNFLLYIDNITEGQIR
jgi:hypothetical protein